MPPGDGEDPGSESLDVLASVEQKTAANRVSVFVPKGAEMRGVASPGARRGLHFDGYQIQ